MGPGFPSFPVSWFLLVFIGFLGSETSRNQNAGLLMYQSHPSQKKKGCIVVYLY